MYCTSSQVFPPTSQPHLCHLPSSNTVHTRPKPSPPANPTPTWALVHLGNPQLNHWTRKNEGLRSLIGHQEKINAKHSDGLEVKRSGLEAKRSGLEAKRSGLEAKCSGHEAKRSGLEAKCSGL
ncbi:hypothetical protein Tco_0209694 [Tanacetum coccineum]